MNSDLEKDQTPAGASKESTVIQEWSRFELGLTGEVAPEAIHARLFEKLEENEFFPIPYTVLAHDLLTLETQEARDEKVKRPSVQQLLRLPIKHAVDAIFSEKFFELEPEKRKKAWNQLWEAAAISPEDRQRLKDFQPLLTLEGSKTIPEGDRFRPLIAALEKLVSTPRLLRPALRKTLVHKIVLTKLDGQKLARDFIVAHPGWKDVDPLFLSLVAGESQEYVAKGTKVNVLKRTKATTETSSPLTIWQILGIACFALVTILRFMNIGTKTQQIYKPTYAPTYSSPSVPSNFPSGVSPGPTSGSSFVGHEYRTRNTAKTGWRAWKSGHSLINKQSKAYNILNTRDQCDSDELRGVWPAALPRLNIGECKLTRIVKQSGGVPTLDVLVEFDGGEILYHLVP
ncbi:MAG: hypothetical protein ACO1RA_08255 [Planctomycetaceae bacterium]